MIDHDVRDLLARRAAALDTTQPDQLTRLHSRIRATRRRRTTTALASGALVVTTVAALGAATSMTGRTVPDPTGPGIESTATPRRPAYRVVEGTGDLDPGRWALVADGSSEDTVLAELDVPAGWSGLSWFIGSDDVTVGYWVVNEVPTDPCHETGRHDPGPTVDDLVTALDQQRLTAITGQEPVTVGGYDGTYLEIVAPDIDYSRCLEGQVWYWETSDNGARHHDGPAGAIERVWVIDVDGQRVVFNGLTTPDDPEAVADLERVIASVRFVVPE